MKRALVLSGGGSKGAFQVGVLRYLFNKEKPEYDIITGVSAGALNASMLATGSLDETLPKLEKVWLEEIKGNHSIWTHHLWYYILTGIALIVSLVISAFISFIFDGPKFLTIALGMLAMLSLYVPYYSLRHTKSIYKTEPLRKIVESNLDLEKLKTSGKKLRVGAISYETGEYKSGTELDDNIVDWIMASSAFPLFFPMVEINNQHWIDGGVMNIVLLQEAISLGAEQVDIILTQPLDLTALKTKFGLPSQTERVIDLMSSEMILNDVRVFKYNKNVRIFMPSESLCSSSLNFNPTKINEMYGAGENIKENSWINN